MIYSIITIHHLKKSKCRPKTNSILTDCFCHRVTIHIQALNQPAPNYKRNGK